MFIYIHAAWGMNFSLFSVLSGVR